jgi:hypothetical protein
MSNAEINQMHPNVISSCRCSQAREANENGSARERARAARRCLPAGRRLFPLLSCARPRPSPHLARPNSSGQLLEIRYLAAPGEPAQEPLRHVTD